MYIYNMIYIYIHILYIYIYILYIYIYILYIYIYITTVAQINRNTPPGRPVFRAVALSIFSPDVRCKSRFVRAAVVMLPEPQRVSPFCLVLYMWGGGSERPPISDLHYKRGVSIKRLNHTDRYPGVPSQPLLGGKQSGLSPDAPNRNPTPYVNMCSYHIERWESQLLTFYAGSLLHPSVFLRWVVVGGENTEAIPQFPKIPPPVAAKPLIQNGHHSRVLLLNQPSHHVVTGARC